MKFGIFFYQLSSSLVSGAEGMKNAHGGHMCRFGMNIWSKNQGDKESYLCSEERRGQMLGWENGVEVWVKGLGPSDLSSGLGYAGPIVINEGKNFS